jgi:outer membrane receptor for ferric coprogen and ferric-rhodotorulic acid
MLKNYHAAAILDSAGNWETVAGASHCTHAKEKNKTGSAKPSLGFAFWIFSPYHWQISAAQFQCGGGVFASSDDYRLVAFTGRKRN